MILFAWTFGLWASKLWKLFAHQENLIALEDQTRPFSCPEKGKIIHLKFASKEKLYIWRLTCHWICIVHVSYQKHLSLAFILFRLCQSILFWPVPLYIFNGELSFQGCLLFFHFNFLLHHNLFLQCSGLLLKFLVLLYLCLKLINNI